jgi:two-component system, cell cycle sensor histidine kinase and response regulator CckA
MTDAMIGASAAAGEPQEASAALRDAHVLFAALDAAPSPMAVVQGAEHVVEFANRACGSLFASDRIAGRSLRELLAGSAAATELPGLLDEVRSVGDSGVTRTCDMRLQQGRFTVRCTLLEAGPAGAAQRILIHASPVSAPESAELLDILDSFPCMIVLHAPDGRAVGNRCWRETTGMSAEELAGGEYAAKLCPDAADQARLSAAMAAASGEWIEYDMRGGDGRSIPSTWAHVRLADGSVLGAGRDIAARRLALEEVAAARTKFETLLNAIPDGAFMKDTALRYVVVNEAMARLGGLTPAEMLGRTDADLFPPDMATMFHEQDERVMRDGARLLREQTLVDADGVVRHTETLKSAYHDSAGRVLGTAGVVRDITDRKLTAAALAESEARYRLMVEGSDAVFFYVHDAEGRFEYISPSVEQVLGYPAAELIGRNYQSLAVAHPLNDEADRLMQETVDTQAIPPTYTAVSQHREGRSVFLEIVERPITRDGVVTGIHGFARDVTERTAAEIRLAELNARLLGVVDTSPLPIVVLDLELKVLLWNHAAERLFGWSADEVLGQPYPLRAAPGFDLDPAGVVARVVAGDRMTGIELKRLARDERLLHLQFWTAPLCDSSGALTAVLGIFADRSDRLKLEEQLQRAQKLEAIGRLAGGIAHDFNNVLTAIGGHAVLAASTVEQGTPLYEDLREIRRGAEQATELTRQLLAFSRQQVLQPRILELGAVITELRRMLGRLIGEDIDLQTTVPESLWCVRADPGQIEQVVLNLAVNARDAMPTGGSLYIQLDNVVVDDDEELYPGVEPGDYVELQVRDTGCGIPEEDLAHIFEPFFTTKDVGKGTGLGLATVHGVVAQSGGHLFVDSSVAAGTTFRILLPRADGAPEARKTMVYASSRGTETVLLVEDEPAVRAVARIVLKQAGYTVLEAAGGYDALDLADRHDGSIDVVLSDLVMPLMSGYALVERLREKRPDIRVLLMSGYSEEMVARESPTAQLPLLQKPFSPDELKHRIREILDDASI